MFHADYKKLLQTKTQLTSSMMLNLVICTSENFASVNSGTIHLNHLNVLQLLYIAHRMLDAVL